MFVSTISSNLYHIYPRHVCFLSISFHSSTAQNFLQARPSRCWVAASIVSDGFPGKGPTSEKDVLGQHWPTMENTSQEAYITWIEPGSMDGPGNTYRIMIRVMRIPNWQRCFPWCTRRSLGKDFSFCSEVLPPTGTDSFTTATSLELWLVREIIPLYGLNSG